MSMIALLHKSQSFFTHLKRLVNLKNKRFGLVTSHNVNVPKFVICKLPIDEQRLIGVYEEDI